MVRHSPHVGTRSSWGGVNMMPTAELLVVETTRPAACPKQLMRPVPITFPNTSANDKLKL